MSQNQILNLILASLKVFGYSIVTHTHAFKVSTSYTKNIVPEFLILSALCYYMCDVVIVNYQLFLY